MFVQLLIVTDDGPCIINSRDMWQGSVTPVIINICKTLGNELTMLSPVNSTVATTANDARKTAANASRLARISRLLSKRLEDHMHPRFRCVRYQALDHDHYEHERIYSLVFNDLYNMREQYFV